MRRGLWAVGLLALAGAGCFPISPDVNKKGEVLFCREEGVFAMTAGGKVSLVHKNGEGESVVWCRWSPDGTKVLYVSGGGGGGPMGGGGEKVVVAGADGSGARTVYTAGSNLGYALWSPKGDAISVGEMSQKAGATGQNMPVITVRDLDGKGLATLADTGYLHDWLPDGSGVVVFRALKKLEDGNHYLGAVMVLNRAGGVRPVVKACGDQNVWLDVSPDGARALFTALSAVGPKAELPLPGEDAESGLYLVALADGKLRKLSAEDPEFGLFSPDGRHILANNEDDLVLLDAATGKVARTLASEIATSTGGMGDSAQLYPAWGPDGSVYYWRQAAVHGKNGTALRLMRVKADGTGRRNVQVLMDVGVEKLVPGQ